MLSQRVASRSAIGGENAGFWQFASEPQLNWSSQTERNAPLLKMTRLSIIRNHFIVMKTRTAHGGELARLVGSHEVSDASTEAAAIAIRAK